MVAENFTVREEAGARTGFADGVLHIAELSPARAATVAVVVAQSAAMEYYERLVEDLFRRTDALVDVLEKSGTVRARPTRLHRFIGEAITSRNEVLSVLHLLDKPDEVWEDPELDRIYDDLRAEFDLTDHYQALEAKLRGAEVVRTFISRWGEDMTIARFARNVVIGVLAWRLIVRRRAAIARERRVRWIAPLLITAGGTGVILAARLGPGKRVGDIARRQSKAQEEQSRK
jgi:uncharacterized Rmd1/YagE family protein